MTSSWGPSECGALCDYTSCTPTKLVLRVAKVTLPGVLTGVLKHTVFWWQQFFKVHEDGASKDVLVRKLVAHSVEGGRKGGKESGVGHLVLLLSSFLEH